MTICIIAFVLAGFPVKALATSPDIMSIVKQMKEVFEPSAPAPVRW